jgi:hypothetical protein
MTDSAEPAAPAPFVVEFPPAFAGDVIAFAPAAVRSRTPRTKRRYDEMLIDPDPEIVRLLMWASRVRAPEVNGPTDAVDEVMTISPSDPSP